MMTRRNIVNKVLPALKQLRTLLLLLMMMVGVSGAWGQTKEKPADSEAGGCSETWLRVSYTEALPSITGAKVII